MLAGEMYIADDEELVADRVEAKRLTRLIRGDGDRR